MSWICYSNREVYAYLFGPHAAASLRVCTTKQRSCDLTWNKLYNGLVIDVVCNWVHKWPRRIQLVPTYDLVNTDAPITRYKMEDGSRAARICTLILSPTRHWRATLGAGSNPIMPNARAYSPDPPIIPSTYPIPEYFPSTPQSVVQPEIIDTVKTGMTDDSSPDFLHDR